MADDRPKVINPAGSDHVKFKPVDDSGSGDPGKLSGKGANTPTAPAKFRAVSPTEPSSKSPRLNSHNDSDDPPKLRAVASRQETQGSGV